MDPDLLQTTIKHNNQIVIAFINKSDFSYERVVAEIVERFRNFSPQLYQIEFSGGDIKEWVTLTGTRVFVHDDPSLMSFITTNIPQLKLRTMRIQSRNTSIAFWDFTESLIKNTSGEGTYPFHTFHLGQVQNIMIVTKPGVPNLVKLTSELTLHILSEHDDICVYVADTMLADPLFEYDEIMLKGKEISRKRREQRRRQSLTGKEECEGDPGIKVMCECGKVDCHCNFFTTHLFTWSSQWTCEDGDNSPHCKFSVSDSKATRENGNNNTDTMRDFRAQRTQSRWRYGDLRDSIDLVATLGGDGTLLYVSMLFQKWVPPVVSFDLGSLGFLTPFSFSEYEEVMHKVLTNSNMEMILRIRIHCGLFRKSNVYLHEKRKSQIEEEESEDTMKAVTKSKSTPEAVGRVFSPTEEEGDSTLLLQSFYSFSSFSPVVNVPDNQGNIVQPSRPLFAVLSPQEEYRVLNEVVVDRGSSASLVELELYADGEHFTTYLADGIVVATSTGSTAYSLSAGGSLVHPSKRSILVTPICPHSLTCRPLILPGEVCLRIVVPPTSRCTAWASFDGRHRLELLHGDYISMTASRYPFPTICRRNQSIDWFTALDRCLHWNVRKPQHPISGAL